MGDNSTHRNDTHSNIYLSSSRTKELHRIDYHIISSIALSLTMSARSVDVKYSVDEKKTPVEHDETVKDIHDGCAEPGLHRGLKNRHSKYSDLLVLRPCG